MSVHREDEGADAEWPRVQMVEECTDLIEGVLVGNVAVGLGFGDQEVGTPAGATSDDVGSVSPD